MSTASTGPDPELIQEVVQQTVIVNYVLFASVTVLVFDLFESFESEVKYFWNSISAVTVLYFTNRYGAILATILGLIQNALKTNDNICRLEYLQTILQAITMLCVDYILLLRVQALYSRGRAISSILYSAFTVNAVAGIAIAIHGTVVEDPQAVSIAPGLTPCFQNSVSGEEGPISWGIPSVYGALLMALALYKAAAIWKESAGLKGLRLVKVLVRDQAIYFLAVIFVSVAQIVSTATDLSTVLSVVLNTLGNPPLLSILGARLLFNMKEAGEKGLNQGTSCPTRSTVSEIGFAAPPAGSVESALGEAVGGGEAEIEEVPV